MDKLQTITFIVSENVGKKKEELMELVLASLPSVDHAELEMLLDSVLNSLDSVVKKAVPQKSLVSLISSVLKALFLHCTHATAVQVVHPPPTPQPSPASEPEDTDEPPPLEPSPEKV